MSRRDWGFLYRGDALVSACDDRIAYHTARLAWWEAERDRAEADFRETGIEFRDREMTSGHRVDPVFDPEKQRRLGECREKVRSHTDDVREFRCYRAGLSLDSSRDRNFTCTADDIAWLGLGDSDEMEEAS